MLYTFFLNQTFNKQHTKNISRFMTLLVEKKNLFVGMIYWYTGNSWLATLYTGILSAEIKG